MKAKIDKKRKVANNSLCANYVSF